MIISFLGSLPLGTLNIAAMQIGIQENIKEALFFSAGSLFVEMIYVRISLIGIDWVRKQQRLMKVMEGRSTIRPDFLALSRDQTIHGVQHIAPITQRW